MVWVVGDECIDGSESGMSFKQALFFKELGFNIHDTMIYEKDGIGFPNPKRYHQSFEYMFILSKGTPKTVNLIEDRANSLGGDSKKGRWERQKNGETKFRDKDNYSIKEMGARWNIWRYAVGYQKTTKAQYAFEHPAMFPEYLAGDHIKSWSNEGDIVLDPFNGSGTTTKMAKHLNRKYLGIEISPEYIKIAENRLKQEILL